jgi:glycosyltransferase involved in cell wall biosynthesis
VKKAALVITTYNNPKYLGLCLSSFSNQTSHDFDIFVADDGSKEDTRAKIEELRPTLGRPLQHFWQPDTGYNKSAINNEVFRKLGSYDVVICVDHDIIAHHRFIEDHLAAHAGGSRVVFMGRRVELGPDLTARINEENVTSFNSRPGARLLWSALKGDTLRASRAFRIGSTTLRSLLGRDRVADLLGSNFSVSRELLYEVNGYNEDYKAYWGEDGDLFIRLRNTGAELKGSKSLAIQFHLDHKRLEPSAENQRRYAELLSNREYRRCENGIVKSAKA